MTKEKVIDILKGIKDGSACLMPNMPEDGEKAIDIAIKAVEQSEPHWIPVAERLPDKEGDYLVTDDAGGVKTIDVDTLLHYDDSGEPFWCYSQNPVAWRELPVPFGEE